MQFDNVTFCVLDHAGMPFISVSEAFDAVLATIGQHNWLDYYLFAGSQQALDDIRGIFD